MQETIERLEGRVWPEPEWQSGLVLTAHALRKKPLDELTPNDLRVAFTQDAGADFVKTRVLEILEAKPTAGDLFAGDLIFAVMRSRAFRQDEEFWKKIVLLADAALRQELDSDTKLEIESLRTA